MSERRYPHRATRLRIEAKMLEQGRTVESIATQLVLSTVTVRDVIRGANDSLRARYLFCRLLGHAFWPEVEMREVADLGRKLSKVECGAFIATLRKIEDIGTAMSATTAPAILAKLTSQAQKLRGSELQQLYKKIGFLPSIFAERFAKAIQQTKCGDWFDEMREVSFGFASLARPVAAKLQAAKCIEDKNAILSELFQQTAAKYPEYFRLIFEGYPAMSDEEHKHSAFDLKPFTEVVLEHIKKELKE